MTPNAVGLPTTVVEIALSVLAVSLALAVVRLVRGPTLPDRVVALDLIATIAVGMVTALAIGFDEPVLLQAAVVLALITFLGTVAFARYVEKSAG